MLPHVDGLEICRAVRANEKTAAIPIIMLTARAEESERIVGLEIGADDYIAKPFSPNELVARVRALLRRATGSRRGRRPRQLRIDCRGRRAAHGRLAWRRRRAHRQGVPAARVPAEAPGPRAVARRAADRRLGLQVHGRHANGRRARAPPAREAAALGEALVTVKQFGYKLLEQPPE